MSDSEEENENFCYYGKPLEPYDEDSIPKKRPISVEEQIATDAQGRRRFHGAFTGGFSAGFFNTVGSLEGWLPGDFKSSRSDKAKNHIQKPEDFMDEEDLGKFGIAPQVIKATEDYNTSKKRKKQVFSDGPIPGEPVLHQILSSGNQTVGYLLLKNLGIKQKIRQQQEDLGSEKKIYGCQIPRSYEITEDIHQNTYEIPQIYKDYLLRPKDNTFGLDYKGLNKNTFSLFPEQGSSKFTVIDKTNKKISITGQAFGVGAFEDEDDDIYVREDMTKYDFELADEKKLPEPLKKSNLILDMFIHSKIPLLNKKMYPPPKIPHSFTGKHKVRKSRFEPIKEEEESKTERINPAVRAKYLGEDTDKEYTESRSVLKSKEDKEKKEDAMQKTETENKQSTSSNSFDITSLYLNDKFVSSSKKEDVRNILEPVEKFGTIHGTEQMRDAARMKMFGALTRITLDWVPCSLLCKKFNVPEPFMDRPEKQRTRTKNLIFEYQKHVEEQGYLKPGLSYQKEDTPIKEETECILVQEEPTTTEAKIEEKEDAVEEDPKDLTEKLNLDEKQDLFKAIFLSSDESEDEPNEKNKDDSDKKMEELKSVVLSDDFLPKIKPIKEGILSGVNFHQFTRPNVQPKVEEPMTEPISDIPSNHKNVASNPNLYGPKIPERQHSNVTENKVIVHSISTDSEDEWIEKDKEKKKKHKKEKKHKKDKHKKHKHDRKKEKS